MIDILAKFGDNIDFLRVCADDPADFIEAISFTPNLNHLELVLHSKDDRPKKKFRYDGQLDDEINLLRLKKLNIERANDEFLVIFNRLPAGVLVELTVHQNSIRYLTNLFRGQVNVKKLTIVKDHCYDPVEIPADLLDNLQIEVLNWRADSFRANTIRSIMAKQTNLKILKLIDGDVDVRLLEVITNHLNKLETLSISVNEIPISAVRIMSKLLTLKELTLQSGGEEDIVLLREFATLDNSRITTLNIQYLYDISADLLKDIKKSLPNLKSVTFHCDNNVQTFNEILKTFNYVQALHLDALDIEFDEAEGDSSTLVKSACKNDKLNELVISYPMLYPVKLINKMVKNFPHLKKLIILPTNEDFKLQCEAILKGFREMESLSILRNPLTGPMDRRTYNLNKIVSYGSNLNFLALLDFECTTFPKLRIGKKIRKKLGLIEYSWTGGIKMAVGRTTMDMNWEGLKRHHFLK